MYYIYIYTYEYDTQIYPKSCLILIYDAIYHIEMEKTVENDGKHMDPNLLLIR